MPKLTLRDLLPIPPGTREPHAYQVFGLEEGEQDAVKIRAAITRTVAHLKSTPAEGNPEAWRTAARLVKQAQAVLADPQKKAALDARFGIVALPDEIESAGAPDPLAALLPDADPFEPAGASAFGDSAAPAVASAPSNIAAAPPTAETSPAVAITSESASFPQFVTDPAPRRRKQPAPWGALLFGSLCLGMLGTIAALTYFLFLGPGTVEITQGEGQLTIRTGREADSRPRSSTPPPPAASPPAAKPAAPPDRVMGKLAEAPRLPGGSGQSLAIELGAGAATVPMDAPSGMSMANPHMNDRSPAMPAADDKPSMAAADEASSAGSAPAPAPANAPPEQSVRSADAPPSEQAVARGEAALTELAEAIRSGEWGRLAEAVEKANRSAATASQREQARALSELVDLALYYRGGLERAMEQLSAGEKITIGPIAVIVVEADREALAIRRSAKTHRYELDELPPKLVHTLAAFTMSPESPDVQAAQAVYESLADTFDEQYRRDAVQRLRQFDAPIEGAEAGRLADTIEWLFR